MVAMGFFILMVILFFGALFFITLNTIFIIIWKIRKHLGKNPKKRYLVIPVILLIISIVVELIPIGWLSTVRSANSSRADEVDWAKSSKIVYWSQDENGDEPIEKFKMNGTTYIEVDIPSSSDTWKLGEAVANLKYKSNEKGLNKFMNILFASENTFTSTLYPVKNRGGFDLYTIGSNIYCPLFQVDKVKTFYDNFDNYDTHECIFQIYYGEPNLEFKNKKIVLNAGEFEKIDQIFQNQKLKNLVAKNVGKDEEGTLYAYSHDGVTCKTVDLILVDGIVYYVSECVYENENRYIKGYRLSTKETDNLKDLIFE